MEVGPSESHGFGRAPISHQELLAWQINMRRMLQPWELQMLRRLSIEWVSEMDRAEEPDAKAPWLGDVMPEELARVSDSLRQRIRGMAKK